MVRPHLFVSKNPEKPKKVSVDLTGHTYDGRCKRLVNDAINVLVFVVLDLNYLFRHANNYRVYGILKKFFSQKSFPKME